MEYTSKRFTGTKRYYTLGQPLKDGRGGEGIVYRIKGRPGLVAKIYHQKVREYSQTDFNTRRRKLECMLKYGIRTTYRGKLRIAWPQDILYSGDQMVGYVMPRVKSSHGLYEVWMQGKQDAVFRKYTWRKSVRVAQSLAQAIAVLHESGIIVGDFNPKNFLVDRAGNVILVDTDSFDITDPNTKERFPCQAVRAEILAPELQGCHNLSTVWAPFSKDTDYFSLALLIFRLLMGGFHPFGCICVDGAVSSSDDINERSEIRNGNCAYVREIIGRRISPQSPTLEFLPEDIRNLFVRTFHYTAHSARSNIPNRASAQDWIRSLSRLRRQIFRRCRSNHRHVFPGHNRICPFCGQKRRSRIVTVLAEIILAIILIQPQSLHILEKISNQATDTASRFIFTVSSLASDLISDASGSAEDWSTHEEEQRSGLEQDAASATDPVTPEEFLPPASADYILPSDKRLLNPADVEGMTRNEVQLAINEIYARHGRVFSNPHMRDYFLSKSWYSPQKGMTDSKIVAMLSQTEWENLQFLIRYRSIIS